MRYLVLVLLSFLVSCATPQSAPRSFYGAIYAPGKVTIESGGVFVSTAIVKSAEFMVEARKAAYLRLMEQASSGGFQSVRISKEDDSNLIGYKILVHGTLFKRARTGKNIYPVSNISRVLNGLSLESHAVVKSVATLPKQAELKVRPKIVTKKPVAKQMVVDLPQPTNSAPSVVMEPQGGPTVIMAPEDITGSVKKANNIKLPAENSLRSKTLIEPTTDTISIPKALAGTPLGVVVRSN